MIRISQLTLRRGVKVILDSSNLTIFPGQKIGIVGANGAGKSSLFALLRQELHQDAGELSIPPSWQIAHVAQETPALACSARDYVLDGDAELRMIEAQLAATEHDGIAHAEWLARFELAQGYSAPARAAKLLSGLGFSEQQLEQPVSSFSGGWRMRLNLAQALMCRSDLLLLDEPTNHLDLDAVIWLESWLKSYPGTLLLISHDREFLDNTVNGIVHVANQQLTLYTGNYADFERQKAEKLAQQQQAFDKQQREVAHLQSYIDRFRAKATKARQAQSRIKALERMERIAAAHVDTPFSFSFREPDASPNPLLKIDQADVGYGQSIQLHQLSLSIESGSRIGLLGVNGAGKSTLIKLLSGELAPLNGQRIEGKGLKIGYFAQHQLEQLRPEESPLKHLQRLDPTATEQDLRNFLGGFDFRGDAATNPVEPFSGGEKSRLCLALLIWQKPNLLLLDEPTNHLDLEMRHALTMALQDYVGAIIVVSHDRALLAATTDRFLLVENGKVAAFDGDLDDYRQYRAQNAQLLTNGKANDEAGAKVDRKAEKRAEAEARQLLSSKRKPIEQAIAKIEKQLTPLQTERNQLEENLAGETLYQPENKDQLKQTVLRQTELTQLIENLELEWLTLQEQLEELIG